VTTRPTDLGFVWSDWTTVARPRTAAVAGAAAAAGVATDPALRNGPPTVAGAVLVFVAAAGLVVAARPTNRQALALIALAPVFGVFLVLRYTYWVLPVDVLAAGALLTLSAAYASLPRLDTAARSAVLDWLCGPSHENHSGLRYNVSNATAWAARTRVCSGRRP